MIFHPGVLALLLGSATTALLLSYCAYQGARIIRGWDMSSGSEQQLEFERRTYLISTIMSYVLGFQFLSLFLFIFTADTLSSFFVGAMCAAGSLKVNGFGYPALIIKICTCLLAGLWLIVNHTDNKAPDYPLAKIKYWILLCIYPLFVVESVVLAGYLLGLKPNIITSCCGVLFSADARTVLADLVALPLLPIQILYFVTALLVIGSGLFVYLTTKGGIFFAFVSIFHFVVTVVALISFISIYIYELPTHHCPFCILHQEYRYVGYPIYFAMLISAISGLGVGALTLFQNITSLRDCIPLIKKRLAQISILANSSLVLLTGCFLFFSNLSMKGY